MESFQLIDYSLKEDGAAGDWRLFIQGSWHFRRLLEEAFPALFFMDATLSLPSDFSWGVQFKPLSHSTCDLLEDYLSLLRDAVYRRGVLDLCFALSFQSSDRAWDDAEKRKTDDRSEAKRIAWKLTDFIRRYPIYRDSSVIAAVPSYSAGQSRQSAFWLKWIARETGLYNAAGFLEYSRQDSAMKAETSIFAEKSIVLVDDLSHPEIGLDKAEKALRQAGAAAIFGLTADGLIKEQRDDAG
ncbi:MAG: hypothetical protein AB1656_19170 [Candidatus Omnitrophota bacterium]